MDLIVLLIILVVALLWRGSKTLPQLGAMLGRGTRSARTEADRLRSTSGAATPVAEPDQDRQKPA
jgi:Sec-independent protein translocase protein TatA